MRGLSMADSASGEMILRDGESFSRFRGMQRVPFVVRRESATAQNGAAARQNGDSAWQDGSAAVQNDSAAGRLVLRGCGVVLSHSAASLRLGRAVLSSCRACLRGRRGVAASGSAILCLCTEKLHDIREVLQSLLPGVRSGTERLRRHSHGMRWLVVSPPERRKARHFPNLRLMALWNSATWNSGVLWGLAQPLSFHGGLLQRRGRSPANIVPATCGPGRFRGGRICRWSIPRAPSGRGRGACRC